MWKGFEAALSMDETISWRLVCLSLLTGTNLLRFISALVLAVAVFLLF